MTGTIKNIDHAKNFGFILGQDKKEYFMHRSALKNGDWDSLRKGQDVTFEEVESTKGPRAEDVFV